MALAAIPTTTLPHAFKKRKVDALDFSSFSNNYRQRLHHHSLRAEKEKEKEKENERLADVFKGDLNIAAGIIIGIPDDASPRVRQAIKRPRLSPSSSSSSSPSSSPSCSPPPTPVLAHRQLPTPPPTHPTPPPPSPSPSPLLSTSPPTFMEHRSFSLDTESLHSSPQPQRSLRPSRYQHFTSPLCPRPLHANASPNAYHPYQRRPLTPMRTSSPPHYHYKYNSLLHWTLQRNHHFAVRHRQYLAAQAAAASSASSTSSSSSTTVGSSNYQYPYPTLQIHPYNPCSSSHSAASTSTSNSPDSDESGSEDSDSDADDWDDDCDDGWDEGETDRDYPIDDVEPPQQQQNYTFKQFIVVPSQNHGATNSLHSTSMSIPRACTPPNSRRPSPEPELELEEEGEGIEIKEGVTTIVLS